MVVRISERDFAKIVGKKPRRKKARTDEAQFDLVYEFREKSNCWHPIEVKAGKVFCKEGLCR